jgi:sugar phosphate isomerase/epimerase
VAGRFEEKIKEIYETTSLVLSLHVPFSDLNIASVNVGIWAESIRQIKESVDKVHEFIQDICVVHPGIFPL